MSKFIFMNNNSNKEKGRFINTMISYKNYLECMRSKNSNTQDIIIYTKSNRQQNIDEHIEKLFNRSDFISCMKEKIGEAIQRSFDKGKF